MIKHFIRSVIRLCRRLILGPRLAPLADLSQGEVLNLVETAAAGYGAGAKLSGARQPVVSAASAKELSELKALCAALAERVQVLERTAKG